MIDNGRVKFNFGRFLKDLRSFSKLRKPRQNNIKIICRVYIGANQPVIAKILPEIQSPARTLVPQFFFVINRPSNPFPKSATKNPT